MDYKKTNAPLTTTVHDIIEMAEPTGNIYETVCIISKRANQIAAEMKSDLEKKVDRFRTVIDEYYSFINDYPESKMRKEADNIFKIANKHVNGN